MAFSYVFTLFMFFGGLFGAGNDLLDYVPAEAYWKLKAVQLTYANMADQVVLADPAAAVNLAKVFESSTGADRDRLALALIDQGESARAELERLAHSADADLAARAKACIEAINTAPKERAVRRLMAIRTLGGLGKPEAIPLLQPLLKSREPFVAAYAAEAIASLEGKPAPIRSFPTALKDDIWRLPADCRAVAQIAPRVAGPEMADRVLAAMNLPAGMDRSGAIDGLTFTLVQIADRFGDMRFDGITLAASGDLGESSGYLIAIMRGYYDHATVNRILSEDQTPFNDFPGGRIYVPGGMALYAPSDDLLFFAASPKGTPPVQAVITAAGSAPATQPVTIQPAAEGDKQSSTTRPAQNEQDANLRLQASDEIGKLIASIDTTQPLWLACKGTEAYRSIPGLAGLETLTLSARRTSPGLIALHVDAKLSVPAAARELAAAIPAQVPGKKQAAETEPAVPDKVPSLLDALSASMTLSITKLEVTEGKITGDVSIGLARSDVMRLLLTSMREGRAGN